MSKDCSSGTPAFIMVASWRVNKVTSLSLTLPPLPIGRFLTLVTTMPWRRSVTLTTASPPAFISPLMIFPDLSLPSQR
jgi:hypothetical protein